MVYILSRMDQGKINRFHTHDSSLLERFRTAEIQDSEFDGAEGRLRLVTLIVDYGIELTFGDVYVRETLTGDFRVKRHITEFDVFRDPNAAAVTWARDTARNHLEKRRAEMIADLEASVDQLAPLVKPE